MRNDNNKMFVSMLSRHRALRTTVLRVCFLPYCKKMENIVGGFTCRAAGLGKRIFLAPNRLSNFQTRILYTANFGLVGSKIL